MKEFCLVIKHFQVHFVHLFQPVDLVAGDVAVEPRPHGLGMASGCSVVPVDKVCVLANTGLLKNVFLIVRSCFKLDYGIIVD